MNSRFDLPDATDRRTRGLHPEPMTPTEARQGFRGRPVLVVLLVGILLALIAWIPAEWWGNAIAPDDPSNQPVENVAPSPAENSNVQR
ncbi:hypothetical protein HHL25_14270 [Rhizobium sp. S-51]|uniref:Uncharacterized protein n=1 Tax=Rhizobium terricola TaxID=2728849 RepID=A0A7Y0AXI2_9HYPH|nr:hypothetical protein [Rhizobium terricola]NML75293.1 hypothetical protein [Rhizobium terricola]